jgi:hypothetical protein
MTHRVRIGDLTFKPGSGLFDLFADDPGDDLSGVGAST